MTRHTAPLETPEPTDPRERKRAIMTELERHPFRPSWWLLGPHAQTVFGVYFRRLPRIPPMRLERWSTPDDDLLRVHLHEPNPTAPWVLLLHGLEGSVRSHYMMGMIAGAAQRDWNVAAVEFRSCGGEMNRARRLYHSGETTDLDFVVRRLIEERGAARIFVSGVSLGGNVTIKWLGELGEAAPSEIAAAAVMSPPFDLTASGPHLDRAAGGLYARRFLRTLLPKAEAKERQYPGSLDLEALRRARTFEEFDTLATARLHGFRDAWEYWARVGCGQFLQGVRRPTLLVASADDPFNPGHTLPRKTADHSPWLYPRFTRRGGHAGFVEGGVPWRTRHWAEEQTLRFFEMCRGK
jgi:predicted alpha/beta-fold hydrolase